MSPKQADKLIRAGQPVNLHNTFTGEDMPDTVLTHRDRWNVYTATGAKFDRGELVLTQTNQPA